MKLKPLIITVVLLSLSTLCFSESWVVIVNKDGPLKEITAADLKRVYLGEKISWPSGKRIKVASIKKGEAYNEFLHDIVKISPMRFSRHWKKIVFTGSGTPIKTFKTDEGVIDYVKANPNAIGCIPNKSLDDSVRKVKVSRKTKAYKPPWK
ncbi:MAG: hypothetical protein GY940_46005 [bacterium]|nr:hypothetical protein [bacterium]